MNKLKITVKFAIKEEKGNCGDSALEFGFSVTVLGVVLSSPSVTVNSSSC